MKYYVGTSGWHYRHWKGLFYPDRLPIHRWLSFYGQHFSTVEINVTFYREVKSSTFEKWLSAVSVDFLFCLKMSRFITHIRRLDVDTSSVNRFVQNAVYLSGNLGVILIQLPPALRFDESAMKDFFAKLDTRLTYAVEARSTTFIDDRFFALLEQEGIAWCIADSAGRFPFYEAITAPFVYIRLHGSEQLYASRYSEKELTVWRDKIRGWDKDAFIYFDNDFKGYAVDNALSLKTLLGNGSRGDVRIPPDPPLPPTVIGS